MTHLFNNYRSIAKSVTCALVVLAALVGAAENCAADLLIRITSNPGSNEKIYEYADGDTSDSDLNVGIYTNSLGLNDSFVDNVGTLIFDFVDFSISTHSTLGDAGFDLLLSNATSKFVGAKLLIEVTQTNIDPSGFTGSSHPVMYSDIGGLFFGLGTPNASVRMRTALDVSNQPYGGLLSPTVDYTFTDTSSDFSVGFSHSDSVHYPSLTGQFSLSASFEITATAADQGFGFDAFQTAVAVPEPLSLGLLSGVACITGLSLSRRKARSKRQIAS